MTVVDLRDLASVLAEFPLPAASHFPVSCGLKVACAPLEEQVIRAPVTETNIATSKTSRRPKRAGRLATHLENLEQHDPRRVFVAKRISHFGLNNGEVLREHFKRYGAVTEVMLVNAPPTGGGGRKRPSGMAYVLMDFAADVDQILLDGGEAGQLTVGDAQVAVSVFWNRQMAGGMSV